MSEKELIDELGNNLLADKTVDDLIDNIHKERERIIAAKLKEIADIDLDLYHEAKLRFKRFVIEYDGNEETIYFNDGSETGKRIVTFVRQESPLKYEGGAVEINVSYTYY